MSKHERTLRDVFKTPTPSNIRWSDVEALLRHLGAEISEGSGSRVRVAPGGVRAVFHRPPPQKEANQSTVRDVRSFLSEAGITP